MPHLFKKTLSTSDPDTSFGIFGPFITAYQALKAHLAPGLAAHPLILAQMMDFASLEDMISYQPRIASQLTVMKNMIFRTGDYTAEERAYMDVFRVQEEAMKDLLAHIQGLVQTLGQPTSADLVSKRPAFEGIYVGLQYLSQAIDYFHMINQASLKKIPDDLRPILSTHFEEFSKLRRANLEMLFCGIFAQHEPLFRECYQQDPEATSVAYFSFLITTTHLTAKVFPESPDVGADLLRRAMGLVQKHALDVPAILGGLTNQLNDGVKAIWAPKLPHLRPVAPLSFLPSTHGSTQGHFAQLSEYSSELNYDQIPPLDRPLTLAQFQALPVKGSLNPYVLRLAQGGINSQFRDGKSLETLIEALVLDPGYAKGIPPVEIGIYDGKVWSFDTRRLVVFMKARERNPNVTIPYQKIDGDHLTDRIQRIFSPRPWNGFVAAVRRGGKGSESEPYTNPAVRAQLEAAVEKSFKSYPSDREGADQNGFPIQEKAAQKIWKFLNQKKQDSTYARLLVKLTNQTLAKEGKSAAYKFLIDKKAEITAKFKLHTGEIILSKLFLMAVHFEVSINW